MIVGILLVQAVACAVLSAIVASNKNRNVAGWGALGFLFGVLGFIAAIAVSEVEENADGSSQRKSSDGKRRQKLAAQKFNPDDYEKKCPMCAERIKLEALVCRYCGHEFSEEEVKQQVEKVKREFEKQQEKTTQEGTLYCERHDTLIRPEILTSNGTCPVCGNPASDEKHPLAKDISGGGG